MVHYFERLGLPASMALASLYAMAVLEVLLGLAFLALFGWSLRPAASRKSPRIFANRTVHRLAFKGSILVFVAFSAGDILFADRAELWEHGTFMVLVLLTYQLWFRTDSLLSELDHQTAGRSKPGSLQAGFYERDSPQDGERGEER